MTDTATPRAIAANLDIVLHGQDANSSMAALLANNGSRQAQPSRAP